MRCTGPSEEECPKLEALNENTVVAFSKQTKIVSKDVTLNLSWSNVNKSQHDVKADLAKALQDRFNKGVAADTYKISITNIRSADTAKRRRAVSSNTKIDFEMLPSKAGEILPPDKVKDVQDVLASSILPLKVDGINSGAKVLAFEPASVSLEQERKEINKWHTNQSTCYEGYRERVCSRCMVSADFSESFKKSTSGECSRCPAVWASVMSLFGVVIAFVAWMCFSIQLALRGAKSPKSRHSQLFKSLLSHVQVAALAKDFDLK